MNKIQFNVYLPPELKEHIEDIVETTNLATNSDAITLLIAYVKKYWTEEDWNKANSSMKVFGENGLVKIS